MSRNGRQPKHTYIDLFCGCGGLSLGLESAGFDRLLANDVSPMAAETFAYNLVEGARDSASPGPVNLGGGYFDFLVEPRFDGEHPDGRSYRDWRLYPKTARSINRRAVEALSSGSGSGVVVGRAELLAKVLASNPIDRLRGIDLLAGGPPCQSFSLAGKRQKDHERNSLFRSFVKIAELTNPRVILFENVLGITAPFRDGSENPVHPWFEVCKAFFQSGYVPIPSLVDASFFGVPQTRLRFIMIALRQDVAEAYLRSHSSKDVVGRALSLGLSNYRRGRKWKFGDDRELIFRSDKEDCWPAPLFPDFSTDMPVSLDEAIGDLLGYEEELLFLQNEYAQNLDAMLPPPGGKITCVAPENRKLRAHCNRTKARFRLMRQIASGGWRAKNIAEILNDKNRARQILARRKAALLDVEGNSFKVSKKNSSALDRLFEELASAKHAQRCLDKGLPAPAQLSIPDDFIHWGEDRVLTIREMARIQSFPDWFEFRSKETTGGSSRAFEVPQYTQVGNAVPPMLARAFGDTIRKFLDEMDSG